MGLHEYGKEDAIVVRCTNWRNNLKTLLSLGDEDSTKSIVVADELVTQVWPLHKMLHKLQLLYINIKVTKK